MSGKGRPTLLVAVGGLVALATIATSSPADGAKRPPTHPSGKHSSSPPTAADPFSVASMHSYLASRTGTITAAVFDVTSGQIFRYNPGVAQQTASIIKVDILATLLWEAQTTPRPLSDAEQDLATGMIEDSDNDDATALWDDVGASSAIGHFDRLAGLNGTSPNAQGFWGETTTTAWDQVELLKHVALPNSVLDATSRAYELRLMENVVGYEDWGVSNGPTAGTTVALKNGWLPLGDADWQINSIGAIDGDSRDYLLAVLTTDDPTEDYGIGTIEGISRIVWLTLDDHAKG